MTGAMPSDARAMRSPSAIMSAEALAAMQPCRISASRALMVRAVRERWKITRLAFDIDDTAKGTAFYRIETPCRVFDFPVYSFEFSPKGRTGRIIGRSWDMMAALVEGPMSAADIAATRAELPKLYEGRATPGTLIWCRSNRSSRAFNHAVERLERVGRDKKTESSEDYLAVNPKGSVPALKLEGGEVLTEAAVIQQYIADQVPAKKLAPAAGMPERYRLQEWLNYTPARGRERRRHRF